MLFHYQKFPLVNEWKGLFYHLRQYSSDILSSKLINIISSEPHYSSNFCNSETTNGNNGLVDGDEKVCFANKKSAQSDAYFIIDLLNNSFKLSGFGFKTACCHPTSIKVEAGQTRNSLKTIGTISEIDNDETKYFRSISSGQDYKVFKFSMPNINSCKSELGWRFQFAEIEFFGEINPSLQCIQKQYFYIQNKTLVSLFLFLASNKS